MVRRTGNCKKLMSPHRLSVGRLFHGEAPYGHSTHIPDRLSGDRGSSCRRGQFGFRARRSADCRYRLWSSRLSRYPVRHVLCAVPSRVNPSRRDVARSISRQQWYPPQSERFAVARPAWRMVGSLRGVLITKFRRISESRSVRFILFGTASRNSLMSRTLTRVELQPCPRLTPPDISRP
jgi:hypothetical protein